MNSLALISGNNIYHQFVVIDWKFSNFQANIKLLATNSEREILLNGLVPGAVEKIAEINGEPIFFDLTLNNEATIIVEPLDSLSSLRRKTTIWLTNYAEEQITQDMFVVTLSGYAKEWKCSLFPSTSLYPSPSLYPCSSQLI